MKRKNLIISSLVLSAASLLAGCGGGDYDAGTAFGNTMLPMVWIIGLLVVMYVIMILPENKRKKKAQEMRNSIEVGDKITTIGGIVGKVVHVTNDTVTFETGEDRVRIEVTKWAISANEGKGANKETTSSDEKLEG